MKMKKIVFLLCTVLIVFSCSKSDNGTTDDSTDSFDRSAMLVNWADQIIVPSYASFTATTTALETEVTEFVSNPTEEQLTAVRLAWETAYLSFQDVAMFEIGRAEEVRFRNRLNTYPVNTSEVDGFISTGNYDFTLPSTNDAQGFPAMDYLLYGLGTSEETLAFFTTNANAGGYKNYLNVLAQTIDSLAQDVLNSWNTGYRDEFVSNDGASASASVDKLTNDFILYYEKALRAGKVGIPAGVFSNDPLPSTVEGFYRKNLSKQLAIAALDANLRFFKGTAFNTGVNGSSYSSYLDFLNTIKNGEDLSTLITNQFTTAKTSLNSLDNSFVAQIETNNTAMLNTYDELQRNVILLKVDMLQALSIDVDFVDTDGD